MQCRACGAEMRLMQFVLGDTRGRVPAIERRDFKCSACPQVARRVVFSHALASADELPPLATHTEPRAIQPQTRRSAGPPKGREGPKLGEVASRREAPQETGGAAQGANGAQD